jgi:hypothetical protein
MKITMSAVAIYVYNGAAHTINQMLCHKSLNMSVVTAYLLLRYEVSNYQPQLNDRVCSALSGPNSGSIRRSPSFLSHMIHSRVVANDMEIEKIVLRRSPFAIMLDAFPVIVGLSYEV